MERAAWWQLNWAFLIENCLCWMGYRGEMILLCFLHCGMSQITHTGDMITSIKCLLFSFSE